MSRRSLFIIDAHSLECVGVNAGFAYGAETLADRAGAPVAIGLHALIFEVGDSANCLIHRALYSFILVDSQPLPPDVRGDNGLAWHSLRFRSGLRKGQI